VAPQEQGLVSFTRVGLAIALSTERKPHKYTEKIMKEARPFCDKLQFLGDDGGRVYSSCCTILGSKRPRKNERASNKHEPTSLKKKAQERLNFFAKNNLHQARASEGRGVEG